MNSLEIIFNQKDNQIQKLQIELQQARGSTRNISPAPGYTGQTEESPQKSPKRVAMRLSLEDIKSNPSPYTDIKTTHAKSVSLGGKPSDQHERQPSHDRFSSNFDYQLNYQMKQNDKLARQCEEYKRTITNYETAVQTLTKASKEKHKEQKAKNKIVNSYLEQTKLDH